MVYLFVWLLGIIENELYAWLLGFDKLILPLQYI